MYRPWVFLVLGLMPVSIPVSIALAEPLRDPTRPLGIVQLADSPAAINLKLTATRVDAKQSSAVINGHRLGPGEWLGSAQVVEIGLGWARLRRDGQALELRLLPMLDKSPGDTQKGEQQ